MKRGIELSRPRSKNFVITLKNGDVFKVMFGITATELRAMTEEEFLKWRNSDYKGIEIKIKGCRKCKRCKNLADRIIDIDDGIKTDPVCGRYGLS